jgi:hypothetical protein
LKVARPISHVDLLKTNAEGLDLEVLKGGKASLPSRGIQFIFTATTFQREDS